MRRKFQYIKNRISDISNIDIDGRVPFDYAQDRQPPSLRYGVPRGVPSTMLRTGRLSGKVLSTFFVIAKEAKPTAASKRSDIFHSRGISVGYSEPPGLLRRVAPRNDNMSHSPVTTERDPPCFFERRVEPVGHSPVTAGRQLIASARSIDQ